MTGKSGRPMGEEHNVVFGQGQKVNRATSTLSTPSICLMRHIEGEVSVLLALLTLGPCPKTTLCSSPIKNKTCSKAAFGGIWNRKFILQFFLMKTIVKENGNLRFLHLFFSSKGIVIFNCYDFFSSKIVKIIHEYQKGETSKTIGNSKFVKITWTTL